MLAHDSRESGIEFAVGWFLFALGVGLLIPRPGLGLWSIINAGGRAPVWSACITTSSLALIYFSYFRLPAIRFITVAAAMACWSALAFRFVEASLWGAAFQSFIALSLLNACLFRLIGYLRRRE